MLTDGNRSAPPGQSGAAAGPTRAARSFREERVGARAVVLGRIAGRRGAHARGFRAVATHECPRANDPGGAPQPGQGRRTNAGPAAPSGLGFGQQRAAFPKKRRPMATRTDRFPALWSGASRRYDTRSPAGRVRPLLSCLFGCGGEGVRQTPVRRRPQTFENSTRSEWFSKSTVRRCPPSLARNLVAC